MTTKTLTVTNFTSCSLPISRKFNQWLVNNINKHSEPEKLSITINFRDITYIAKKGDFYLIEAGQQKQASQQ